MKKNLFLVVLACLLNGCFTGQLYYEHRPIGKPIPKAMLEDGLNEVDRPQLKTLFFNSSRRILLCLGIYKGVYRIDPGQYAEIKFDSPGIKKFLVHAWIRDFQENGQTCYLAPQDFAGEGQFRVVLDNTTKKFMGEEYGDVVIFTDSSFRLDLNDPYPKRFLKGPGNWDNIFVGSFYCIKYNRPPNEKDRTKIRWYDIKKKK